MRDVPQRSLLHRSAEALAVSIGLIIPLIFAGYQLGEYRAHATVVTREAQPPGFFEGRGAITLQCLWDDATDVTTQVSSDAPSRVYDLQSGPGQSDWEGQVFVGVLPRSDHHWFLVTGQQCATSVDFSSIPLPKP